MNNLIQIDMVFVVVINLAILGSSRIATCIRLLALQGIALSLLPIFVHWTDISPTMLGLTLATLATKGILFPWLLVRAMREANVRREVEPYIGYTISTLIGLATFIMSLWLAQSFSLPDNRATPTVIAAAFSTVLIGLFLIVSRRKAISQVLGFVIMENGTYAFGIALLRQTNLLIELGILLDAFVAVFVMGIAIYSINREFDHLNADQLDSLKG